ncbi:MAG TPA: carbohydrate porin, partial [Chitinophagaceae bacterium]
LRAMFFFNDANMGSYKTAITSTGQPDIKVSRVFGRKKFGAGINYDQELNDWLGLFGRAGWNDGKNETWAFTEIDRTVSAGLSLDGARWNRKEDVAAVALVVNGLSADHRNYLERGGSGFIIGDGRLNYSPEAIGEFYYRLKPPAIPLWFTLDYQFALHPGYNKDRGPVNILSVRVHTEF